MANGGNNSLIGGVAVVVLATLIIKGLEFMGFGFFGEITNHVVDQINEKKLYADRSDIELQLEDHEKQILEVERMLALHTEDMIAHGREEPEGQSDGPLLETLVVWSLIDSEKGKIVLNGNNGEVESQTDFGGNYLVSSDMNGNYSPMVLEVTYKELSTASGEGDLIGRLHKDDFGEIFGGTEMGIGFVSILSLENE